MYIFKFASLSYHSFRSFYVAEGEKSLGTCFRSSERKAVSTPPFRVDFTQHSSARSSYGPLRKTNLCQAFLQREESRRFMFTNKTHCLLWAVWHWDTFRPKQFETQSPMWQRLNESVDSDSMSETHCLLWAVWLWDTFQLKQCETQSPMWRRLNRSFGGHNICGPRQCGCMICNLTLRHAFSVQQPFVRHASSKAVVSSKSMCAYRLTVRSIIQQPKGKKYRNREPSRVQVKKIMQKLQKRKVRKHLKVLLKKSVPKSSTIYKLVTNYKATLVRFLHRSNCFFTSLKHRFNQRSVVYNFCPNESKLFHRISSVSKHKSFKKNRGSEIEKWKVRAKPSKTTVTSQIGPAKIVYKSLMHRMTHFKFNLCRDIEKNPGPVARRQFMNYCLTQPGKYSCAIDSFLELAFAIFKDSLREINCNVFFQIVLDACL